jgi:hypothetical protein
VQTESATLLAVLAAPTAVLVLVLALAVALLARRGRRSLGRAAARLQRAEAPARDDLSAARAALARATIASAELRRQGRRLDADIAAWTTDLAATHHTIERVTRGRLGPTVRAMQLAAALARVALLWRTPAR